MVGFDKKLIFLFLVFFLLSSQSNTVHANVFDSTLRVKISPENLLFSPSNKQGWLEDINNGKRLMINTSETGEFQFKFSDLLSNEDDIDTIKVMICNSSITTTHFEWGRQESCQGLVFYFSLFKDMGDELRVERHQPGWVIFDKEGRLIGVRGTYQDTNMLFLSVFFYDYNGNLIRQEEQWSEGKNEITYQIFINDSKFPEGKFSYGVHATDGTNAILYHWGLTKAKFEIQNPHNETAIGNFKLEDVNCFFTENQEKEINDTFKPEEIKDIQTYCPEPNVDKNDIKIIKNFTIINQNITNIYQNITTINQDITNIINESPPPTTTQTPTTTPPPLTESSIWDNPLIVLIIIPIFTGLIVVYVSKGKNNEKHQKDEDLKENQLNMYTDIAYANHWNWLPNDVGINDPRYQDFMKVINLFISYIEKVDPEIKETYRFVVEKFTSGYKEYERQQLWLAYEKIREFSKKKAKELGNELNQN